MASVLAQVNIENETVQISEYTPFLASQVHATHILLISTAPCSVESGTLEVNASIQEPPPNITGIMQL